MKIPQKIVIVFLITIFVIQAVFSAKERSPTIDEITYLGVGKYLLEHRRYDIPGSLLHPPLSYYIHSIPLFLFNIDDEVWKLPSNERGIKLLNSSPDEKMLFLARVPIILIGVVLSVYIFKWASALFGVNGGLFALFLYVFDPNILAHAGLITPDLVTTCFVFIALYYLWKLLSMPNRRNIALGGIFLGLALLSKFTAVLLIPMYGIVGLCSYVQKRAIYSIKPYQVFFYILAVFSIAVITLIMGYGLRFEPILRIEDRPHVMFDNLLSGHGYLKVVSYYLGEHIFIPFKPYIKGVILQWKTSKDWAGRNYLMGKYSPEGFWNYYLIAFLIKTPISLILFFLLSIIIFVRKSRNDDRFTAIFLLLPVIFIPLFFSWIGKINTGLRYILPIFPFVYVFSARVVTWQMKKQRVLFFSLITLGIWYMISSLSIYPYYLAYFNESIGGPKNGYKYLVNSNLSWGQDVKGLVRYLKQKGIKSVYWGATDHDILPEYYGVNSYIPLPGRALLKYDFTKLSGEDMDKSNPEVIALSANSLPSKPFKWLTDCRPIAHFGYSIYLYDITDDADAHYKLGLTYLVFLEEGKRHIDKFPEWKRFAEEGNLAYIYELAIREFQRAETLRPDVACYNESLLQAKTERDLMLGR